MTKFSITASTLLFALCSYSAHGAQSADIGHSAANSQGLQSNGIALNGIALNGKRHNGIVINGIVINGIALNGRRYNGIVINGIVINGAKRTALHTSRPTETSSPLSGIAIDQVRVRLSGQ